MIVVRNVFQAKYGRGDELVALFHEMREKWIKAYNLPGIRILTDYSGTFFTVVTEFEVDSIAKWEESSSQMFGDPEFEQWFAHMTDVVVSGQREFYRVDE